MKVTRKWRSLSIVLILCLLFTSIPAMAFADTEADAEYGVPIEEEAPQTPAKDVNDLTEEDALLSESGKDYTTFDIGADKKYSIFYLEDVRFEDEEGNLKDYDPELIDTAEVTKMKSSMPKGYAYRNKAGDSKHFIPENLSIDTPVLMEKDGYHISMVPTEKTYKDFFGKSVKVKQEKEKVEDAYGQKKDKKVKASFKDETALAYLEYVSLNQGVKENIVLNKEPAKNVLDFELSAPGLEPKLSKEDGSIAFYEKDTDELIAMINPPNMNDASGNAYSENLKYTLTAKEGEKDTWILTLTISKKYLKAEERQYPVTIDPTTTWVGDDMLRDVYVSKSSPNTNYYGTARQTMPVGKGSTTTYRSYMHFLNLKSVIDGKVIDSANLKLYETADSNPNNTVDAFRITSTWDAKGTNGITWNTQPTAAASRFTSGVTKGNEGDLLTLNVKTFVSGVAKGNSNYGIRLQGHDESLQRFVKFYGSRTTTTGYRPKLVVTYSDDIPTIAETVKTPKTVYEYGEDVPFTWTGINAQDLDYVKYRVSTYDEAGNAINGSYIPYTKITGSTSSGTVTIPGSKLKHEARYAIVVRGVSKTGFEGPERRTVFFNVTKDKPATPKVTPSADFYTEGSKVTVSWVGLSAKVLSEVQYRVALCDESGKDIQYAFVPYTKLNVTPAETGTAVIPDSETWEPGVYRIYIRGVNGSGLKGRGYGAKITIKEDEAPTVESVTLTVGGTSAGAENYVRPGAVRVTADGIRDEEPVLSKNLNYTLHNSTGIVHKGNLADSSIFTNSDGSQKVIFDLPEDVTQKSDNYELHFAATDQHGHKDEPAIAKFKIDADNPTGSISVLEKSLGAETEVITENVNISAIVSDADSKVKNSSLTIYPGTMDSPEGSGKPLIENSSQSKDIEFSPEEYADGNYCLKLHVIDNVGYTYTTWKNIVIDKPLPKPIVSGAMNSGNRELKVSWGFQTAQEKLHHLQYSLDKSETWTDVEVASNINGSFLVPLAEDLEGTHSLRVRGVEEDGTLGEIAPFDFNIDTEAPTVYISSIDRGIVHGIVMDDNLKSWKISLKARDEEGAAFTETASGVKSVQNGIIALSGLSDGTFAPGWYIVKLEAEDEAGNLSETTYEVEKKATDTYAEVISSQHRILRSLGQNLRLPHFIVRSTEEKLSMADSNLFSSGAWFVDQALVSEDIDYQTDFSAFEEGKAQAIAAAGRDASGNLFYSQDIYTNVHTAGMTLPSAEGNEAEVTLPLLEQYVGFTLNEDAAYEGITWQVKTADGEYKEVTPGELTYILELDSNKITTDALTVKAIATEGVSLENVSFTLQLASMEKETFAVSSAEGYWPENITAQDKINYKTYVRWDVPETMPEGLSYEVYRSTIKNFVPGETTFVAGDVTDGYWCDMNTNYNISLYYKVRAVIKDENGNIVSASSYSDLAESTPIDRNEYLKALGHKDYWAYADIATPSGNGYIEKSQGNFLYEQNDAEIANEQLGVSLTRTYNSMATSKSAFGYGWTHNYDIELLRLGKDSNLDEGILVLRDGSGTLYQFKTDGDTYISSLGKYVNLKKEEKTETIALTGSGENGETEVESVTVNTSYTMTTRDNLSYYFDKSGKLVWMEESNGNLLLFHYDEKRGLLDRITTGNNISVEFTYNESAGGNDALTIHDMTLPDGQKVVYSYENSMLTGVTKYPAGEASGGIHYTYGYSGRKMTSLTDGMANTYRIQYAGTDGKADSFIYPSAGGSAESIRVTQNKEEHSALTERLFGSTTVKKEKDYFDIAGQCIQHTDYSGNEEKNTYYEYMDSLLRKETEEVTTSTLNLDETTGGSVVNGTTVKVKEYLYDAEERLETETEQNRATGEYAYAAEGEWTSYQPTQYTETTEDGMTTADETYLYDEYGNLVRLTDNVNGTFTNYSYYTGAENSAKGALKSEEEYLISDGTCISSTTIDIQMLSGGGKKETTTIVSGENKTVSEVIYDVMGRELSSATYTYSDFGTAEEKISKESSRFSYDGFGRVKEITTTTSKVDAGLSDIAGTAETVTESKTYDANGTLISETDKDGITTSYQYDAMNRVTRATKSNGGLSQTTTTGYGYGSVSVNEGKDGLVTYPNAFVTTETTDGLTTSVSYQDGMGRTVRQENEGVVTDYSYDLQGNQLTEYVKQAEDKGLLTLHAYDENGNETATLQNPVWNSEAGSFVLTSETICETSSYDMAGNLVSNTDGNGNKTNYSYDDQGRITGVTPSGDKTTTYSYNEYGEEGIYQSSVTRNDVTGATSTEVSDVDGNVVLTSDRAGSDALETSASYDAFGNLIEELHISGSKIAYSYDHKDRVSEKLQIGKDGSVKYKTVYTYYNNDLVKEKKDYKVSGGVETLYHYVFNAYDSLKRLTSKAEVNGSTIPSDLSGYTSTYTYNLKDQLTEVTYENAMGSEVDGIRYTYSGSRLTELHVVIGGTAYLAKAYAYNMDGSVATVKDYYNFRNGDSAYLLLTYDYDQFGRVSAMTYTKNDEVIEKHTYSYDKNSNIVREGNLNALAETDEVRDYVYDRKNQLEKSKVSNVITKVEQVESEADEDGNVTLIDKITKEEVTVLETDYAYDEMGNRIQKVEKRDLNTVTTNYTYNGLNQLLTEKGNGKDLTYIYDTDGNQSKVSGTADSKSVTRSYSYTPGNMLESYTEGTKSQQNLYNGEGQRVQKKEGSDITNYYYQEGSVLRTTDVNDNLKSFNLLNISDAFATSRKEGVTEDYFTYTEDFRGSTVNILDKGGTPVVSYLYDDFGNAVENKAANYSAFNNEIQYTGAIHDALTGLLYLNARFYEPRTGRFITRDTYRGEKDNADTWHLYLYCTNNPINYVDPSGHRSYKIAIPRDAVAWGIDIALGGLISRTAYGVFKKELKKLFTTEGRKRVDKIVKKIKPIVNSYTKKYNRFFSRVDKIWNRTTFGWYSKHLSKNSKKKMGKVFKEGAVNLLVGKLTSYLGKIIQFRAIDCITSFGGFFAGAIEVYADNNLDGWIRFKLGK